MSTSTPRPLVLPEMFAGEEDVDQWFEHFEDVAAVNAWEGDAMLLWLKVRLTGRARTAFQRLAADAKGTYKQAKKALRERFEPPSKKELYLAELQCRSKKRSEGWAEFAEDVRLLTDKAHPQLEDAAREQLALIHYMGQLSNPQVALGVKQTRPKTLDAAVTATLETESFLPRSNAHGVSQVEEEKENLPVSGAAGETSQPSLIRALERLGERVGKLELKIESTSGRQRDPHRQGGQQPTNNRQPIKCRRCGQEGHYARGCAGGRRGDQGN